MRKLNEYFFGGEEVSTLDYIWFYGGVITMFLLEIIVLWKEKS